MFDDDDDDDLTIIWAYARVTHARYSDNSVALVMLIHNRIFRGKVRQASNRPADNLFVLPVWFGVRRCAVMVPDKHAGRCPHECPTCSVDG